MKTSEEVGELTEKKMKNEEERWREKKKREPEEEKNDGRTKKNDRGTKKKNDKRTCNRTKERWEKKKRV